MGLLKISFQYIVAHCESTIWIDKPKFIENSSISLRFLQFGANMTTFEITYGTPECDVLAALSVMFRALMSFDNYETERPCYESYVWRAALQGGRGRQSLTCGGLKGC